MEPEKKSNGALIGSIIVIIILIAGGVYFWMTKMEQEENTTAEQQAILDQLEAAVIEADNTLGSIENDIDVSGVETLDLEKVADEIK